MAGIIEFVMHLDKHLAKLVEQFGYWTYLILFLVIFAETGLIIFPFLPGDSLLFVLGILASNGTFKNAGLASDPTANVFAIFILLSSAAMIGDQVSYRLGSYFGHRLFTNPKSKIFKPENLEITEEFYKKHGPKTVLLARFVPVVRGLAPFVAGMGDMSYYTFCKWSVSGAFLWVGVCVFGGYFFGQIPAVKDNFELGLLVIVLCSIIPAAIEVVKHRKRKKARHAESLRQAEAE